jgi:hypothetical protein
MENMDQKAGIIVNIKKADVDSQPNMSSFWLMASVAENRGFTMIYDPNLFFFLLVRYIEAWNFRLFRQTHRAVTFYFNLRSKKLAETCRKC